MTVSTRKSEKGFSMVEMAVVFLAIGVLVAAATPRITAAMRQHRLKIATRQIIDTMQRAKMLAVSENRTYAVAVDTSGRRMGVAFLNTDGTIARVEYMTLPQGVNFQRPSTITANPPGVTGTGAVSFTLANGIYRQDFNSRGFPSVTFGSTQSVFLGNGTEYSAVTLSSVGGLRTFQVEGGAWVNTKY